MNIVVDVNLLGDNGKEYIEIIVPPYPVAISCKGVYYYRSGSTMQTLSGLELESFILRKRGASWDNMPLPGFTIDDIDDELVKKFKILAVYIFNTLIRIRSFSCINKIVYLTFWKILNLINFVSSRTPC